MEGCAQAQEGPTSSTSMFGFADIVLVLLKNGHCV